MQAVIPYLMQPLRHACWPAYDAFPLSIVNHVDRICREFWLELSPEQRAVGLITAANVAVFAVFRGLPGLRRFMVILCSLLIKFCKSKTSGLTGLSYTLANICTSSIW